MPFHTISRLEPKRVGRVFLDANVLYSAGYKDMSVLRKLWELRVTRTISASTLARRWKDSSFSD
jgi:hypothetical protein